ncbi:MAG: hypothetical protein IJV91_08740, partial [Kiritimatiellae bacterium]|nr:hypothetical protein [Kiritimatiellia bacterium]
VPPELAKGGRCAALRVSDVFVECGSRRILGGVGSNVYPTVDAGIYAMTNQIVAAVMKVSSGKATVTRLQMNRQGGYGEVKFFWTRKSGGVSELLVRGYVNAATGGPPVLPARRQMAVCTFLHTKGDGIKARFGHKGAWAGLRLVATADQISHRRARRIHGRYVMKVDDCFTGTAVEMGYNVGKAAGSGT